eukprot:m.44512 g.44512  ORF g.44512 m.44512 type:complete len:160 (+) comp10611_c0_seq9:219-698(+)
MSEENMALPEGVTEIYNDFFQLAKLDVSIPKSVVDGGKIVTVDSDMTVKEAVKLLAEHEILSAPVRDVKAPEDASWMDKYTGTIDAINLMYWLLDKEDGVPPDTLHDLLQKEFTDDPIQDVLDADPCKCVTWRVGECIYDYCLSSSCLFVVCFFAPLAL